MKVIVVGEMTMCLIKVDSEEDEIINRRKNMKYALLIALVTWIIIFSIIGMVYAAPYAVSDPTAQAVTDCGIQLDSNVKMDVDVEVVTGGKRCKYDLTTVSAGTHTIKATFVNIDPTWGRSESVFSAPFTFTRPVAAVPTAPIGLVLTPQ